MNATRLIAPLLVSLALSVLASPAPAEASRIRELTDVSGLRENQLIGYGLVVGLANTGDTGASRFTLQSVAAMLPEPPSVPAAPTVTAELRPNA